MTVKSQLLQVLSSVLITLGIMSLVYAFVKPEEMVGPGPITTIYECDYEDIKRVADELGKIEATESGETIQLPEVTQ